MKLSAKKVREILGPGGILSKTIAGYELRPSQEEMAEDIVLGYNEKKIGLIEAGTGTGKSIAYLVPALLFAADTGERTVISTHTINLQEQLLYKDIPILIESLDLDLKVSLVKGMHNYLCIRKLDEALQEKGLFPLKEEEEIEKIWAWKNKTGDGSKSDLPFMPSSHVWEAVYAEGDACNHVECPHYKNCFFFKARKEAEDAQILIVNHHLLCADIQAKEESKEKIGPLPGYARLIIDEGHHLEDVATEHFALKTSRMDLMRLLSKLFPEKKGVGRPGKLLTLKNKIIECLGNNADVSAFALLTRIEVDLVGEKHALAQDVHHLFSALSYFFNSLDIVSEEKKWRFRETIFEAKMWEEEIAPKMKALIERLGRFVQSLSTLEVDIVGLNNEKLNDKTKSVRLDITAIRERLQVHANTVDGFTALAKEEIVQWAEERASSNLCLIAANLEIAEILQKVLFSKLSTVFLCSATLTTKRQFDFIKKRLGLLPMQQRLFERIYDSPFDYMRQSLFAIPKDIPAPNDRIFVERACQEILQALEISQGNAFILFTSFQMMQSCAFHLKDAFAQKNFPLFLQGEDQRKQLLDRFKETKRAVLFGTDSFWEGVDVVGNALRLVIIVKLPFKVPSEPIVQARSERILKQGGDPFLEYSVPSAIVKFKQGFGRLIRGKKDRGCIVCLDQRLIKKGYGKLFLDSLPNCTRIIDTADTVHTRMHEFYAEMECTGVEPVTSTMPLLRSTN